MQQEITFFAKTNFRNKERVFGIKIDDRRRHMYVIGKTGMGKTNLIQNMAIQDIRNGKGVAIVDPHGEFAEECLKAVPSHRINDVIYFNPSDLEYPVALNVMEKVSVEQRHLVASGLVGVFKKIWADSWGPRLEYLLRNAILALLEYPSSTLLGVTRILVDKDYRNKVLEKVTDPVVKSFWTDEFSKYHDRLMSEAIAPIQNKVGQFLSSSLIRNIVGQTKSTFDIRNVMDNQKILIMNLSKGKIGEDNSALLGAMMITKIQLAAMGRVDMPEDQRSDFYLYVDEFQNFATESFANILSEARKYRLDLVLAHQYIAQLDEKVRDAVLGNVGTLVTFRIGAADAEVLEKEFMPTFTANDLVNLAKYNIYLKLMIDGVATNPFSANTLHPISVEETEVNMEKIIKVSRERYGTDREVVEDKISRWSGVLKPEVQSKVKEFAQRQVYGRMQEPDSQAMLSRPTSQAGYAQTGYNNQAGYNHTSYTSQAGQARQEGPTKPKVQVVLDPAVDIRNKSRAASSPSRPYAPSSTSAPGSQSAPGTPTTPSMPAPAAGSYRATEPDGAPTPAHDAGQPEVRQMYLATCSACGIEIQIPFKPDGERPTFCKECLKDFRRQQSKLQQQLQEADGGAGRNIAGKANLPIEDLGKPSMKDAFKDAVQQRSSQPDAYGTYGRHKSAPIQKQPKTEANKKELKDLIAKAMKEREQ